MNLHQYHTHMTQQHKSWLFRLSLVALVVLSCGSYLLTFMAQSDSVHVVNKVSTYTILQYCLMAIFMLLAWYSSPKSSDLTRYKILFITAFIMRVVLLGVEPYTSNDSSRYLFDGRIAYEGYDPYSVSHDAAELSTLREEWQPPQEHAAYVTIYPPLALALFSFSSAFGVEYAQLVWRILLLAAGMLTVFISALVLKKANKLNNLALVALSPLLVLETGVGLHVDAFSALAVVLAVYCWQRHSLISSGLVIGIGMSLKVLPVMLLLPLFFLQKSVKDASKLVLGWILSISLIYGGTIAMGYIPVGSISVFFAKWRNAAPIFTVLDEFFTPFQIILTLLSTAFIGLSAIAYITFTRARDARLNPSIVYLCMQGALTLPLVLSPVLFPWYLLPLIPLLALRPNIYLLFWLLLMPMTYEVLGNFLCCQHWQPALWPAVLLGILYALTLATLGYYGTKKTITFLHRDHASHSILENTD